MHQNLPLENPLPDETLLLDCSTIYDKIICIPSTSQSEEANQIRTTKLLNEIYTRQIREHSTSEGAPIILAEITVLPEHETIAVSHQNIPKIPAGYHNTTISTIQPESNSTPHKKFIHEHENVLPPTPLIRTVMKPRTTPSTSPATGLIQLLQIGNLNGIHSNFEHSSSARRFVDKNPGRIYHTFERTSRSARRLVDRNPSRIYHTFERTSRSARRPLDKTPGWEYSSFKRHSRLFYNKLSINKPNEKQLRYKQFPSHKIFNQTQNSLRPTDSTHFPKDNNTLHTINNTNLYAHKHNLTNTRMKRQADYDDWNDLIDSVSTTSFMGLLFVQSKQIVFRTTIPISSLFGQIDQINLQILSLQTSTYWSRLNKILITVPGPDITIIQNRLKLTDCHVVCSTKELTLADITSFVILGKQTLSVTHKSRLEKIDIIFSDTLYCTPLNIHCSGNGYSEKDSLCYTYIKSKSTELGKEFFPSYETMKTDLSTRFMDKRVHLMMNRTNVFFTESTTGSCACSGDIPNDNSTSNITELIHAKYLATYLGALQNTLNIYEHQITELNNLLNAKALLSYDDDIHSPTEFTSDQLIKLCIKFMPTMIAEKFSKPRTDFPLVDATFKELTRTSHDNELIEWIQDTHLETLPHDQLKVLYIQISTFNNRLINRLSDYETGLSNQRSTITLPLPVLFPQGTQAQSFYQYLETFIPHLIQEDIFKLLSTITNLKIAFYNGLEASNLINFSSKPMNILPPRLTNDSMPLGTYIYIPTVDREISTPEPPLPSPAALAATTSPSTITPTTYKSTSPNLSPSIRRNLDILRELQLTTTPSPHTLTPEPSTSHRRKRNVFTDLLSSATGLSTQEQMNRVVDFEKELESKELATETQLVNVSDTNNRIVQDIRTMSMDINKLLTDEAPIVESMHKLISTQDSILNKFRVSLTALDATAKYAAKFSNIILDLQVLAMSTNRLTSIIQSFIHNTVDVNLINTNDLQTYLGHNMMTSLSLGNSYLLYNTSTNSYIVHYITYALDQPYKLYNILTIPMYVAGRPLEMKTGKLFAINKVNDYIHMDTHFSQCTAIGQNFICKPQSLPIQRKSNSCEIQIIANFLDPTVKNRSLCADKFRPIETQNYQRYITKPTFISITSPYVDSLSVICNNTIVSTEPIYTGSNFILKTGKLGCTLVTSSTIMKIPSPSVDTSSTFSTKEIDILKSLANLDEYLKAEFNLSYGYQESTELLKNLSNSHLLVNNDIYELNKHINRLQEIQVSAQFQPFKVEWTDLSSPSNYLAYIFWILTIIILIGTIFCCVSCYTSIATATKIVCTPFRLLYFLINKCIKYSKLRNTEPIQMSDISSHTSNLTANSGNPQPIIRNRLHTDSETDLYHRNSVYTPGAPLFRNPEPKDPQLNLENEAYYILKIGGPLNTLDIYFTTPQGETLVYDHRLHAFRNRTKDYSVSAILPKNIKEEFKRQKQSVDIKYYTSRLTGNIIVSQNTDFTYFEDNPGYITNKSSTRSEHTTTRYYGVPTPPVDMPYR